tara:strand:- start:10065 stop:11651 length:1587 start_codon:yes stop_codon:yes gene_type:complete
MTDPRNLEVTYGSSVVSGTVSNCTMTLVNLHRIRKGYEDFEVRFDLLLTCPTEDPADFAAAAAALENHYTRPGQELTVTWVDPDGVVPDAILLRLRHSDATGLEIRSEIDKSGDEQLDTALSRLYAVRIYGDLPPHAVLDGVRREEYDLAKGANERKTLTITGEYTAVNGSAASNQAGIKIAAKATSLLSILGGEWKLVRSDLLGVSTNDQIATYVLEYREHLFGDVAATVNDARFGDVELRIRRGISESQGSADARSLATMTASYKAEIRHTQTTGLKALYETEIQPWIIANMKLSAPGNFFALIGDDPELDRTDNVITATLVAVTDGGGTLLELIREETLDVGHGAIFADVWSESDVPIESEDPTPAYVWSGPKEVTFTETLTRVTIGSGSSLRPAGAVGGFGAQPAANNPFANLFGVGAISSPGESFLSFLGPEAAGPGQAGGLFRGAGGGGGAAGASGATQPAAGQMVAVPLTTQHGRRPGVRGIHPHQFDVEEKRTTRTTRYIFGVGQGGGNAQPAQNTTRQR